MMVMRMALREAVNNLRHVATTGDDRQANAKRRRLN